MKDHSRGQPASATLVGLESEVHVANTGIEDASRHATLVTAVLDEIERQHGQDQDRPEAAENSCRAEFLFNGARCYDDHYYVEYCSPPLADTVDAVAAVRAGDRIIQSAVERVQEKVGEEVQLFAARNNTDHRGHSYAAHVNVRLSRKGYERIFSDERFFHGTVVPFFATLPLICGSGSVGRQNGRGAFLTWQRGPFIETLVSEATMSHRPLVNTRDEGLSAAPDRYARLHVIHLDANRAEVAEFIKLGLMKLFGAAAEYVGWGDMSFELENPTDAVRSVTGSPFQPLRLKSGTTATPLEIQRRFYERFCRLCEQGCFDDSVQDARMILAEVNRVLTALERDPFDLVGVLDWPTKFVWLEQMRSRNKLTWADPRLQWADIQYHTLSDPQHLGLPGFRRITDEQRVSKLTNEAPSGSRAKIRGTILRRFGHELSDADWHWVMCRDCETAYLLPDDPSHDVLKSAEHATTLRHFAESLGLRSIPVTRVGAAACGVCNDSNEETTTVITSNS